VTLQQMVDEHKAKEAREAGVVQIHDMREKAAKRTTTLSA
jgi:hypothetical protein